MDSIYLKALEELNKHEAMRDLMTSVDNDLNDPLVRYAEKSELTIKTDCLTCHALMQGTWSGSKPPYTIVCPTCGQSYTIGIQETSNDAQSQ